MAAMKSDLEKRIAENAALQSIINDTLLPKINEIATAVKKIENQPLPLPFAGPARAVEKGHHLERALTEVEEDELARSDPTVAKAIAAAHIRSAHGRGLSYYGTRGR
jgi:hypothetical protein